MFYLSSLVGGFTAFPKLGVAARPREGTAVFWYNLDLQVSLLRYHWSGSNEPRLSLVERIRVLLAPAILCHKEPARSFKDGSGTLLAPLWFFLANR